MRKFLLLVASLLMVGSSYAQDKLSAYSKIVLQESAESAITVSGRAKSHAIKSVRGTKYVDAFIRIKDASRLDELQDAGVIIGVVTEKCITARIPVSAIGKIQEIDNVELIDVARPVGMRLDKARANTLHDKVLAGTDLESPYTGKGVVYGTLDCGIDFNHANFRNSDGSTRIAYAYLPSDESGTAPKGTYYNPYTGTLMSNVTLPGSEYTGDAIKGLTTDMRDESHGTHTIGIGAGSYDSSYKGFAPEADIIACGSEDLSAVNIINSIAYVFDKAKQMKKPAVVNLSLGYNLGSHTGDDAEAYMIDQLSGAGRIVCVSAGNEGDLNLHLEKTFTASSTTCQTIVYDYYNEYDSNVDIWTRGSKSLKAQVSIIDEDGGTVLASMKECSSSNQNVSSTSSSGFNKYFKGSITMEYQKYNGKTDIFMYVNGSLTKDYYLISLKITSEAGETVDVWTDGYTELESADLSGYTRGTPSMSINTMACGQRSISVGAYNSRKTCPSISGGSISFGSMTIGDIAYFSSYGPTPDGRQLPHIVGPGHTLVSSISNYDSYNDPNSDDYASNVSKSVSANGRKNLWGPMSGTSMSCPAVAGIIATWLQADPNLTPEQILEVFKATAINDSYTAKAPSKWGYGKIDSYAGLKKVISENSTVGAVTEAQPLVVYPNPSNGAFKFFVPNEAEITISVYNLNGALVASKTYENTASEIDVDFSDTLTSGTYIIQAKGANTNYNGKIFVK